MKDSGQSSYYQCSKQYSVEWKPGIQMLLDKLKYWIHLEANILPPKDTGINNVLGWYDNLQELMLGRSCSLELS